MAAVMKPRHPVLMPERFGLVEQKRQDFVANVEVGVTLEEIVDPAFWSHVAPGLSAMDRIEVRPDDTPWIAQLRVLYAERNYAKVVLERLFKIEKDDSVESSTSTKHRVEWKGPHHCFSVIRSSDGEKLKTEFKTREDAMAWLTEYEKVSR